MNLVCKIFRIRVLQILVLLSRFLLTVEERFRTAASQTFEVMAKMALMSEAKTISSFCDTQFALSQQLLGAINPTANHILMRRQPRRLFEQPGEITRTHVSERR